MATKRKTKRKTGKRKAVKAVKAKRKPKPKPKIMGRVTLFKDELEAAIREHVDNTLDSYLYSAGPVMWHDDGSVGVNYERRET